MGIQRIRVSAFRLGILGSSFIITGFVSPVWGAEDAAALLARTVEVNRPWLNPSPASGTYSLWRQSVGQPDEITGPFSLTGQATNGLQFAQPYRVGSIVWTPLHALARQAIPYAVRGNGMTNWNGVKVMAVEVVFGSNISCSVGMGGQANVAYSHTDYRLIESADILIEPTNAVPVYMATHLSPFAHFPSSPTWQFDPNFFAVDRGLAPRSFDWNDPSNMQEHQDFQVIDNVWMFKSGSAWGNPGAPFGIHGYIQSIVATNVTIYDPVALSATIVGPNIAISLTPSQAVGFGVETADSPQGPWSAIASRISADGSTITAPVLENRLSQYYRLRK